MRPRSGFWPVTCNAWTLGIGLLATGLIACGASRAQGFARHWSPGTPISVFISEPQGNIVVPPGATVECEALASDLDTWTGNCESGSDADGILPLWSATGDGSFPYGSIGYSTVWQAPTEPGTYTLTITADDYASVDYLDTGSRDDGSASDSITIEVGTGVGSGVEWSPDEPANPIRCDGITSPTPGMTLRILPGETVSCGVSPGSDPTSARTMAPHRRPCPIIRTRSATSGAPAAAASPDR